MKKFSFFKKAFAVLAVATLSVATFTGCDSGSGSDSSSASTSDSSTSSSEAEATKVVRLGTTGQDAESALLDNVGYAYKLGYLEEELSKVGYELELVGFAQAGPAVNEAFAAEEIDVACYADFPLITATSNSIDVKGFAAVNTETNFAILAREGSGIKSGADLEGKNVVVAAGTITQKYFLDVVDKYSLDVSKINQLNSISDAQTLLASGDADAVVLNLSGSLFFQYAGLGTVVEDSTDDPSLTAGFVLAGRTAWLEENPDAAVAISKALIRSQQSATKNPADVSEKLATDTNPAEIHNQVYSYDQSFDYFNPEFSDDYIERVQGIEKFMEDNQLIKTPVDVTTILDNQYVEQARKELAE